MGSPLPESTLWPNGLQRWVNIFSEHDFVTDLGPVLGATGVEGGSGYLYNRSGVKQIKTTGGHRDYWKDPITINAISNRLGGQ